MPRRTYNPRKGRRRIFGGGTDWAKRMQALLDQDRRPNR